MPVWKPSIILDATSEKERMSKGLAMAKETMGSESRLATKISSVANETRNKAIVSGMDVPVVGFYTEKAVCAGVEVVEVENHNFNYVWEGCGVMLHGKRLVNSVWMLIFYFCLENNFI